MARALIFDSGVGGLSVTAEVRRLLPDLSITYAADDAFRPYGEKSEQELKERLPGLLATLADMTLPDIVIIACNTASTTALAEIRENLTLPVVGVVPAIKPAAERSVSNVIGVLGTPGTVRRKYVGRLIKDFAKGQKVVLHGSVKLVQIAEDKLAGKAPDHDEIRREIAPLLAHKTMDHIVLACTHFPLLVEEFETLAPDITWIDSGAAIARRAQSLLAGPPKPNNGNHEDVALLIGPNAGPARRAAFRAYGFEKVIGLMPD